MRSRLVRLELIAFSLSICVEHREEYKFGIIFPLSRASVTTGFVFSNEKIFVGEIFSISNVSCLEKSSGATWVEHAVSLPNVFQHKDLRDLFILRHPESAFWAKPGLKIFFALAFEVLPKKGS